MTVIAWDGQMLASDKQSTNCNHASTVTKIFRVPDGLVGFMGSAGHAGALLEWFRDGRKPEAWPKPESLDRSAEALFIDATGRAFAYSGMKRPHAERYEDTHVACGSGRDYALAAMHLGHDARHAVEVACALDITCGMGVDSMRLEFEE